MNHVIASAVFDDRKEAERAVSDLRAAGVSQSAISLIVQRDGKNFTSDGDGVTIDDGDETSGFVKGVLGGGAIGAALGIAALAIPGVGPLVAAGAIASVAIPGAAATGALLGAATGGLVKVLTDHGVSDEDAGYYETHIGKGSVFVSVDTRDAGLTSEAATDILYRNGGHSSSRAKAALAV